MYQNQDITFDFQSKTVQFKFDPDQKKKWIEKIIQSEGKELGNIAYVFCTDAYLLDLNMQFLHHDTYTDIITFDYAVEKTISGEIYISVPRVKENATLYQVNFEDEIDRVIAHGVLHIIGYKDHSLSEKELMRSREEYYLTLRP